MRDLGVSPGVASVSPAFLDDFESAFARVGTEVINYSAVLN
jgi:hypothetical protein